jgi:hypothetical protein
MEDDTTTYGTRGCEHIQLKDQGEAWASVAIFAAHPLLPDAITIRQYVNMSNC